MADAIAARREARRRKILENSQNRLQIIAGKSGADRVKESPYRAPVPELNIDTPSHSVDSISEGNSFLNSIENGVFLAESESVFGSLSQSLDSIAAGDRETMMNEIAGITTPPPKPEPPTTPLLEWVITHKYDIVVLSLIVQVLYSMSLSTFNFDNGYFFLPLIIYVVTKLIWFPAQSTSSLANALLLLNGIPAGTVEKILNIWQVIGVISQDVCVYLFTTICIQYIIITLKDVLVT